ncbi:uncharacterized protein BP01DRAFT_355518 [Aspergillus saccharolyticus JOP 1030-1]|uniref:YCII-related domain-containing protein n=1 Tax=Aspergillus saccharolyticus JOP 1030-1 TaxID=1450539 RepID=A0A318ZG23_9EURO|nr:hypothetical protein BP01DRAFT_355518 [Aspergillus saccharolyticus JOP 1030-1]PYH46506.1 hypothetical protein BP01DRAFT_355518 [Aspergillus saccharolyticus JOP 1030-1]
MATTIRCARRWSVLRGFRLSQARLASSAAAVAVETPASSPSEAPAAAAAEPREWLVLFPDMPNVLDRRLEIRPRHSPNFVRLHQEQWVTWAGPVFEKHTFPGNPRRPFKGSVMVINEVGKEQIWDRLKSDPYIQEKIWDLENARVIPFVTNMRRTPQK